MMASTAYLSSTAESASQFYELYYVLTNADNVPILNMTPVPPYYCQVLGVTIHGIWIGFSGH
jgi:hypothetical protein